MRNVSNKCKYFSLLNLILKPFKVMKHIKRTKSETKWLMACQKFYEDFFVQFRKLHNNITFFSKKRLISDVRSDIFDLQRSWQALLSMLIKCKRAKTKARIFPVTFLSVFYASLRSKFNIFYIKDRERKEVERQLGG